AISRLKILPAFPLFVSVYRNAACVPACVLALSAAPALGREPTPAPEQGTQVASIVREGGASEGDLVPGLSDPPAGPPHWDAQHLPAEPKSAPAITPPVNAPVVKTVPGPILGPPVLGGKGGAEPSSAEVPTAEQMARELGYKPA